MKKILLLCLLLSMGMVGCGNVSENSGTLSMSAPVNSDGVVTAIATFTPSVGTALNNTPIVFRWYTVGVDSTIRSKEVSITGRTDSAGTATSWITLPDNRDERLRVYVIASTGDLTNKEGLQLVQVDP